MLCCLCKKNQVTHVYEKETNGKKEVSYYCPDCYRRLFLSDLPQNKKTNAVCPVCGTTAKEYAATGLVGCAECYKALEECVISDVISLQGIETHAGKIPVEKELLALGGRAKRGGL